MRYLCVCVCVCLCVCVCVCVCECVCVCVCVCVYRAGSASGVAGMIPHNLVLLALAPECPPILAERPVLGDKVKLAPLLLPPDLATHVACRTLTDVTSRSGSASFHF